MRAEGLADENFALSLGVPVGRVEDGDAGVERTTEQIELIATRRVGREHATDARAAHADGRHRNPGGTERPSFHGQAAALVSAASRVAARAASAIAVSVGFFSVLVVKQLA